MWLEKHSLLIPDLRRLRSEEEAGVSSLQELALGVSRHPS